MYANAHAMVGPTLLPAYHKICTSFLFGALEEMWDTNFRSDFTTAFIHPTSWGPLCPTYRTFGWSISNVVALMTRLLIFELI